MDLSLNDEYDSEKALWRPGRRSFLFMFGAALVAPMLPSFHGPALKTSTCWADSSLSVNDIFTIQGVYAINPPTLCETGVLEKFRVTAVRGSIIDVRRV